MSSLERVLLGLQRANGRLVRGNYLTDLGDKSLAQGAEKSVFLWIWRNRWDGKGSVVAGLRGKRDFKGVV